MYLKLMFTRSNQSGDFYKDHFTVVFIVDYVVKYTYRNVILKKISVVSTGITSK